VFLGATEDCPLLKSLLVSRRHGFRLRRFRKPRRVDGDELDPTDSYVSDWIGTPTGAEPVMLNGNGKPVLGLCGRRAAALNTQGIVVDTP